MSDQKTSSNHTDINILDNVLSSLIKNIGSIQNETQNETQKDETNDTHSNQSKKINDLDLFLLDENGNNICDHLCNINKNLNTLNKNIDLLVSKLNT